MRARNAACFESEKEEEEEEEKKEKRKRRKKKKKKEANKERKESVYGGKGETREEAYTGVCIVERDERRSVRSVVYNRLPFLFSLPPPPPRRCHFSLSPLDSLKAPGRFSEATGAGGIRVELDYTAKGYIYRARMYAEARTSAQRGRPCGFSLDAS